MPVTVVVFSDTSFMVSTTIAVLTISEGAITAEIQVIESHK